MSNAAKIKIVPHPGPSAFGYNVSGYSLSEELGGAMIKFTFSTNLGDIEFRCAHAWVLGFAKHLTRYTEECVKTCREEGIIPFQATE